MRIFITTLRLPMHLWMCRHFCSGHISIKCAIVLKLTGTFLYFQLLISFWNAQSVYQSAKCSKVFSFKIWYKSTLHSNLTYIYKQTMIKLINRESNENILKIYFTHTINIFIIISFIFIYQWWEGIKTFIHFIIINKIAFGQYK